MLLKGKNNAVGQLYAGIDGLATTCQITAGHTFTGIETPFNMTIYDLSETNDVINYEIVTVTNIATNVGYDTFSITRAQEGTSAQGHLIGKNCANLITYGIVDGINDAIGTQTYTEQNFVTDGESATDSLDAIDVGLSSHMAESASKHIKESGSNYIMFDDGTMICWGNAVGNIDIATARGAGYESAPIPPITYPKPFVSEPLLQVVVRDSRSWGGSDIGSATQTGYIRLSSFTTRTAIYYGFVAIGRWKA